MASLAVDAYIILDTDSEPGSARAHIDGRDWELWVHDFVWRFEDGVGWTHVRSVTNEDELTASQREWLALVRRQGRITPSEAADERAVSKSAASQMLGGLAKRGFLGNDNGTYFPLG